MYFIFLNMVLFYNIYTQFFSYFFKENDIDSVFAK